MKMDALYIVPKIIYNNSINEMTVYTFSSPKLHRVCVYDFYYYIYVRKFDLLVLAVALPFRCLSNRVYSYLTSNGNGVCGAELSS